MEKESIRRHVEMMVVLEEICHQLTKLSNEIRNLNLNFELMFMNDEEEK
jgi:hypothetical protein